VDQPQGAVDVLEHADGIGDHDVIERPLDRGQRPRILDIAQHEIKLGVPRVRLGNRLRAEIDADAIGRLERRQERAPAIQLIDIGLEMSEQIALALTG